MLEKTGREEAVPSGGGKAQFLLQVRNTYVQFVMWKHACRHGQGVRSECLTGRAGRIGEHHLPEQDMETAPLAQMEIKIRLAPVPM